MQSKFHSYEVTRLLMFKLVPNINIIFGLSYAVTTPLAYTTIKQFTVQDHGLVEIYEGV
jgi:hypothetical protein